MFKYHNVALLCSTLLFIGASANFHLMIAGLFLAISVTSAIISGALEIGKEQKEG